MSRATANQIINNTNMDSIKKITLYVFILFIVIASIIVLFVNPKIQLVKNAKHVYNTSIEKISTTYGNVKKDAEKTAQESKETWEKNIKNIYKIVIISILVLLHIVVILLYNQNILIDSDQVWIGTWIGKYQLIFHIVLFLAMIMEYFSDKLDNFLKKIFNSIDESIHKNTKDDTVHHKTLATILTSILFIVSSSASFFSKTYDIKLLATAILSLLCLPLIIFNVPGFDSETYILLLFFLANIPFVSTIVNRIQEKDKSKQTIIYIPLLISFFVMCIFILSLMGGIDVSTNTNLFLILSLLSFSVLFYIKSLDNSVYKTFLSLIGILLLFIVTLHYVLTSQHWILYFLGYAGILYYFFNIKTVSNIASTVQEVTFREILVLSVIVSFIFLYLYIRTLLKKVYTIHGELIFNEPLPLQDYKDVKVVKNIHYDYGLSFWVNIQSMNPGFAPQANEFTSILKYGDKMLFTYNSTKNTIKIEITEESNTKRILAEITPIPLQKWNNIIVNYVNGTCDIFMNNELQTTVSNVIPKKEKIISVGIGDSEGINGQICNVVVFDRQFTPAKLKSMYTDFVGKTPPTF
jgi:hypothetical protein